MIVRVLAAKHFYYFVYAWHWCTIIENVGIVKIQVIDSFLVRNRIYDHCFSYSSVTYPEH